MLNQLNKMGTIPTVQTTQPATTQIIPAATQFQQVVAIEQNPAPAPQFGSFVQLPTYGQQLNMTNIIGNPTTSFTQQILMQPPANSNGTVGGMIMNGNVLPRQLNHQMTGIILQNNNQGVSPTSQQYQIQTHFNGQFDNNFAHGM